MKRLLGALIVLSVATLFAKGQTVKLIITGPGLEQPLDVHTADAIAVNPWAVDYLDRTAGSVATPSPRLDRYEVAFYEKVPDGAIKKLYVVYFVQDPDSGKGFVYLPGPGEPFYRLNISTIYNEELNGRWFHASERWSKALAGALSSTRRAAERF